MVVSVGFEFCMSYVIFHLCRLRAYKVVSRRKKSYDEDLNAYNRMNIFLSISCF